MRCDGGFEGRTSRCSGRDSGEECCVNEGAGGVGR